MPGGGGGGRLVFRQSQGERLAILWLRLGPQVHGVETPGLQLAHQVPNMGDVLLEAGGAGPHLSRVVGVAAGHAGPS